MTDLLPLDGEPLLAMLEEAGVRFCGFDHLVAMKEAAGRPEDLIDLTRLREARGE